MRKVLVNISLDDFHPQAGWGMPGDFVAESISQVASIFPSVVFTLFTTPDFQSFPEPRPILAIRRLLHRLGLRNRHTAFRAVSGASYRITAHRSWVKWVGEISSNVEVAVHGCTHYAPYLVPSAEFSGLSEGAARSMVLDAEALFAKAGLGFTKAFRPPAWGVSERMERMLYDLGYRLFSLEPKRGTLATFDLGSGPAFRIPQNWSIESSDPLAAVAMATERGYLFIKGHVGAGTENGLRADTLRNLKSALHALAENFEVEFFRLSDISRHVASGELLAMPEHAF